MDQTRLAEHYTQMWAHARTRFLEGKLKTDPLLDESDDDRYGITLLLHPDKAIANKIQDFLQHIATLEPDQYYYPVSDQHLTILSIISCYSGFQLKQVDIDAYHTKIKEALAGIPPIRIHFKGITASPSTVLIQGFPEDDSLQRLRDQLRHGFKSSALQHSIDSRYRLFTAHSTVIRFRKSLQDPSAFVSQLENYRQTEFGLVTANKLQLVGNDWYQREGKVQVLKTYWLEKPDSG